MTTELQEQDAPPADKPETEAAPSGEQRTDAPPAEAKPDEKPADTSTASGAEPAKPKSALEAVDRVMSAHREAAERAAGKAQVPAGESPPSDKGTKGKEAVKDEGEDEGKLTDDEFKALGERAQRRINTLYRTAKTAEAAVEKLKPKAATYDQLNTWIGANKLSQDEFVNGLALIAAIKNDPRKAWESIQPTIAFLRKQVGEELPADLAERVKAGEVSEQAARELARERLERERLEARHSERDEEEQARQEQGRRLGQVRDANAAVVALEQQWKATDPDYPKKWPHVWKRIEPVLATMKEGGVVPTKERLTKLVTDARAEVEELLKLGTPPQREIRPLPNGSTQRSDARPKSALEAADRALAGMGR